MFLIGGHTIQWSPENELPPDSNPTWKSTAGAAAGRHSRALRLAQQLLPCLPAAGFSPCSAGSLLPGRATAAGEGKAYGTFQQDPVGTRLPLICASSPPPYRQFLFPICSFCFSHTTPPPFFGGGSALPFLSFSFFSLCFGFSACLALGMKLMPCHTCLCVKGTCILPKHELRHRSRNGLWWLC